MKTIKKDSRVEIIEKKSKFIAHTFYIEDKAEAEAIIAKIKKKHNDARHNVYAYRIIGDSLSQYRMTSEARKTVPNEYCKCSDDGEPSGTAGAPILNILVNQNITNTLIIVTRYFGGILLGTGGLVRAYTESASKVLEKSEIIQIISGYLIKVIVDYNKIDELIYYCKQNNINIKNSEYLSNVQLLLEIQKDKLEEFRINISKINNKLPNYSILKENYMIKIN